MSKPIFPTFKGLSGYEMDLAKEDTSLHNIAKRLCGYGYYDTDGVPIDLIEKYMQIGVLWYGNQLRKQRKEDE